MFVCTEKEFNQGNRWSTSGEDDKKVTGSREKVKLHNSVLAPVFIKKKSKKSPTLDFWT